MVSKRYPEYEVDKKQLTKWWFWAIASTVFLVTVQILFRIEAPCKWLDAVWEAGDFISLIGTLVLGYVAVLQTQRANDMAADANETSRKLIDLQKAEYTPVVTVTNFAGITKHSLGGNSCATYSEIIVHEMRCTDGEVIVGYSVSLLEESCDMTKNTFCRDYELHLKYSGRFVMESFQIKEIRFSGNGFEKCFVIKNSMEMSLANDEEFKLFMFLISNEDFMCVGTNAHQYLKATHVIFEIEMRSISGETYTETVRIRKLLVDDPTPELNLPNAELMVSATYQVTEKTNN